MQSADRPFQARRLAGVDQAVGDGRAREPADLLDQLRERLDRLAANHPSARADRIEPPGGEQPPEEPGTPQIADDPEIGEGPDDHDEVDARSGSDEPRLPRRPERNGSERAGAVPGDVAVPGEAPMMGVTGVAPESALDGGYRPLGIDWATDEPYRPWFAADESADPWFIG